MTNKKDNNIDCVVVVDKEALYEDIRQYFNNNTTFAKVQKLDNSQRWWLGDAIDTFGIERVKEAHVIAEQSDYLTGRKGSEWHADFSWLIRPRNLRKVLSGRYRDFKYKAKKTPKFTEVSFSSFEPDEFYDAAIEKGFDE